MTAMMMAGQCTPHFLFRKTEKKMGGASWLDKPLGGSQTLLAAVRRPISCYPRWSLRPSK